MSYILYPITVAHCTTLAHMDAQHMTLMDSYGRSAYDAHIDAQHMTLTSSYGRSAYEIHMACHVIERRKIRMRKFLA